MNEQLKRKRSNDHLNEFYFMFMNITHLIKFIIYARNNSIKDNNKAKSP